jgi:putative tricarboxylic transport membrane protein
MHLSDRLSGLLAAGLGLVVVLYARTFPPMPGQDIGPALFPSLVGSGLIAFGAWLVFASRGLESPLVRFDDWVGRPRMVVNAVAVIGSLVTYIVVVDALGFFITSAAFLSVLMAVFGASRRWILPVALVTTFVIHYGFYSLLRVPLPWGVFEGVAW